MRDASFFTHPQYDWQRRYEALRASLVERIPDRILADRFGYSVGYLRLLRHQFRHGKIDFSEPVPEGKTTRRKVSADVRKKIVEWRKHRLSAGDIAELLSEEGIEISVRTVERILAEEGMPKLPRRTRLKLGRTVKGAIVPERSRMIALDELNGQHFESPGAGIFIFAPFLAQWPWDEIVHAAGLPQSKVISAKNYLFSFLALKLLGNERYSHVGEHSFDPGLGLFAGLNALPKCTALSTYSYGLDAHHLARLQKAFVKESTRLGLYDGNVINLDLHTIPHFGEESELEEHWAGARNKKMKGALTLFSQDAESKLILFTAADILSHETDDQIQEFLSFWQGIQKGVKPTLVFDSKFTTYAHLSQLTLQDVKFITLRRRGKRLLEQTEKISDWKRITIPHSKRKYPTPLVHESFVTLRNYEGLLRQVIMKGTGREKPSFVITNDFDTPVELIVSNYARRWRVENGISEAVKFFNLNALSSPILVKVHFDVVTTMIADTLYSRLSQKLRGFEHCDAPKIYRQFVRGKGNIRVQNGHIEVMYPRRAHNPILRNVPWHLLPDSLPGLEGASLSLNFS